MNSHRLRRVPSLGERLAQLPHHIDVAGLKLRRLPQRARRGRRVARLLALKLGRTPQQLGRLVDVASSAGFLHVQQRQFPPALALGEKQAAALEDLRAARRAFAPKDQRALRADIIGHAQAQIDERQGLRRGDLAALAAQNLLAQRRALRVLARVGQELGKRELQRPLDGRIGERSGQGRAIDLLGLGGIGLLDQIAQPPGQRRAARAARRALPVRERLRKQGHGLADLPALLVDVGEQGQRLRMPRLLEQHVTQCRRGRLASVAALLEEAGPGHANRAAIAPTHQLFHQIFHQRLQAAPVTQPGEQVEQWLPHLPIGGVENAKLAQELRRDGRALGAGGRGLRGLAHQRRQPRVRPLFACVVESARGPGHVAAGTQAARQIAHRPDGLTQTAARLASNLDGAPEQTLRALALAERDGQFDPLADIGEPRPRQRRAPLEEVEQHAFVLGRPRDLFVHRQHARKRGVRHLGVLHDGGCPGKVGPHLHRLRQGIKPLLTRLGLGHLRLG